MGKRIYLSGPITKGNRSHNFYQAAEAQRRLMEAGYAVLNPMLSMMHPDGNNVPWETWLASDLPWVEVSDMVCRLPGVSKGADAECDHAEKHGIVVLLPEAFPCLRGMFPLEVLNQLETHHFNR